MHKIDMKNYERRQAYEFFSTLSDPFYMVTFTQDIDILYRYCNNKGLSFYYGMIWLCNKAINEVEAFRYVIRKDEIVCLAQRNPSFTDLKKGAEQFHIVTMKMIDDIDEFCHTARELSEKQNFFINENEETDDLIYFSCLPWIELTALSNERDLSSTEAKDDSVPRIAWGKYKEENGRKKLSISIEVNHRLIDGVHIGHFAKALDELMTKLEKEL